MKNDLSNIKKSKFFLDNEECIGIPTETVYGLAANAYSDIAVNKIYKLKKRLRKNPLIVHYSSYKMLKKDCYVNKNFFKLSSKFCPGPLTFILKLKKNSKISKFVTNSKNTLAIRFPNHKLTKKLLDSIDYPVAAPSANISTKISPISKEDVREEFGRNIKFILDGGRCKIGLESTIISLVNKPQILRPGGIEVEKINKVLNKSIKFLRKKNKISSPGQNKLHYSPGIPIRMNIKDPKKGEAFMLVNKRKKSGKHYFYLSKNNNLKEIAKNLYKTLRIIKKKNYRGISVEKILNKGLGLAINDRLKRASKKNE